MFLGVPRRAQPESCAGAIVHVRFARVVFGASDPKAGAAGSALNLLQFPTLNHRCAITGGVREQECRSLLQTFFATQRAAQKLAVAKMVQRMLRLAEPPGPDAADALALALTYAQGQSRYGLSAPKRI